VPYVVGIIEGITFFEQVSLVAFKIEGECALQNEYEFFTPMTGIIA